MFDRRMVYGFLDFDPVPNARFPYRVGFAAKLRRRITSLDRLPRVAID